MKKPPLGTVIAALRLAAPVAIGVRWTDYRHCVEVSVSSSEALKRFGVEAKPSVCAALLTDTESGFTASIGLTQKQVYDRIDWGAQPPVPFEDWRARNPMTDLYSVDTPIHCVIHIPSGKAFFLVDLTIGQIRAEHPTAFADVPASVVLEGSAWPAVDYGTWAIKYMPSPHPPSALKTVRSNMRVYGHKNSGLVGDLVDLMALALSVENNYDVFTRHLAYQAPDMLTEARRNLCAALRIPVVPLGESR